MSSFKNQTGKLGSQSDSKTHNNALGNTPGKKLSEEQESPKIEILEKNDYESYSSQSSESRSECSLDQKGDESDDDRYRGKREQESVV